MKTDFRNKSSKGYANKIPPNELSQNQPRCENQQSVINVGFLLSLIAFVLQSVLYFVERYFLIPYSKAGCEFTKFADLFVIHDVSASDETEMCRQMEKVVDTFSSQDI